VTPDEQLTLQIRGLVIWLALCIVYCVGVASLARSKAPRTLWLGWGVLLAATISWGYVQVAGSGLNGLSPLFTLYFLTTLIGIPTASALLLGVARARRNPATSVIKESVLTAVVFFGATLFAALMAMLPDFVTLLRSQA
jgi:hypothetical protein